jgi:hypothetical protein
VTAAGSGDDVVALAGTYNLTVGLNLSGVTLRGASGTRPIIQASGIVPVAANVGVAVKHLEIRSDTVSLSLGLGVGSDLIVSTTSPSADAVELYNDGSTLRDTLAVTSGGGAAIKVSLTQAGTALIRNVTAVGTGTGSVGIRAFASSFSGTPGSMTCYLNDGRVTLQNVIARGRAADLEESVDAQCSNPRSPIAEVTASNSNYRPGSSIIADGGGNQTSPAETDDVAIFADTTLYHQRDTAPTRNAGGADAGDAGYIDPDGHARVSEGQVDIGADEFPGPPSAVTGAASAIGAMSADVTGAVDGHGEGVLYRFEYGTTPALGSMTAEQTTASTSQTSIQQSLTGLPAQTTIYYRVRTRLDGPQSRVAVGATKSFTTLPAFAPVVTTQPADGIGATFATLTGLVNPMGYATTWQFDWGETTGYGSSTAAADAGAGTADVPVSREIDGLTPNTAYHYRAQGTSQIATALGADQTFTTKRLKVRRVRIKPKRFRMGSDLPRVAKVGTVIKFRLNGDAKVKLKFLRIKPGRLVPKGAFKYKAEAGKQRIRFEGRLSRKKKLRPGKYKLVVRAKTEGVKSKKAKAKFRLLPKR